MSSRYQATWNSLRTHPIPQWFRQAKFGIYTHWGVYSVPAKGPNATWYPMLMYFEDENNAQYKYHVETYGHPSEFGYKDFIPMFSAEKFDADEWAELFARSGARFAGPVAEHHDGFCMWDTRYSQWNAANMGPRRDVVGELARAIRGQELKYMVALHHAANWWFYPHWKKEMDVADAQYAGLYGELHDTHADPTVGHEGMEAFWAQARPSKAFLDTWKGKTLEVMDKYRPDMVWFDFGIGAIQEHYRREMLAHYYNRALEWGKEVLVTYKWHHLVPGSGLVDLELGRHDDLTHHEWLTDTTVDDGGGWGYLQDTPYKSVKTLIHYLVDNVSKNGYLLLNVGPKPNGEIPEQARELLVGIGEWLELNGEAIYGTTPWLVYGEGPTQMEKAGYFMEDAEVAYTARDIRFTASDDTLYATCLGWPNEPLQIESYKQLYEEEIESVTMLGFDAQLEWSLTRGGLTIVPPPESAGEHAFVFKIERGHPFEG